MVLSALLFFDDRTARRSAAGHMAMDEALLASAALPVLRVYQWSAPVLSFGYFLTIAEARQEQRPGESLMRRWTGGGMVHHDADFPWSLIVPRAAEQVLSPRQTYAGLHAALAGALEETGVISSQIDRNAAAPSAGLCFQSPAPGDLIGADGAKLAGAGQRRTRQGLLHQGTVQSLPLPANFPDLLAARLAPQVEPFITSRVLSEDCTRLEHDRYATAAWLHLR